MSILIKNALLYDKITDIAIHENRISEIAADIAGDFDEIIDGSHFAALPPFYNTHCHAAMTLLRGLADDLELFNWLTNHIWPAEAKLTAEDVYWGTKLACMEMIRSGTVFYSDMYFMQDRIIRAVEETGIRAAVGLTILETSPKYKDIQKKNLEVLEKRDLYSSRLQLTWAPHAIYTVSEKGLRDAAGKAERDRLRLHIHLAETQKEFDDCIAEHGCTPVEYLDRVGMLSPNTLLAHAVYLTDSDIELIRQKGAFVSHCPCSNYKLVSGKFRFEKAISAGVRVTIGTDGCASNNNLSMFDEMKFAAIGAKIESGSPTAGNAGQVFTAATKTGAEAFGIDAGVIEKGKLADIMLVDLDQPAMVAEHNLISNLVYAADSSCVSTVICNGKIVMKNREIPGMQETLENARRCARRLRK